MREVKIYFNKKTFTNTWAHNTLCSNFSSLINAGLSLFSSTISGFLSSLTQHSIFSHMHGAYFFLHSTHHSIFYMKHSTTLITQNWKHYATCKATSLLSIMQGVTLPHVMRFCHLVSAPHASILPLPHTFTFHATCIALFLHFSFNTSLPFFYKQINIFNNKFCYLLIFMHGCVLGCCVFWINLAGMIVKTF